MIGRVVALAAALTSLTACGSSGPACPDGYREVQDPPAYGWSMNPANGQMMWSVIVQSHCEVAP